MKPWAIPDDKHTIDHKIQSLYHIKNRIIAKELTDHKVIRLDV